MKTALHIYAVNGGTNSGDFFLGPATKYKFEKIVNSKVSWKNHDVRKSVTLSDINYFNSFDYIVIGGGGLFLPDTNPNDTSCWQFPCPAKYYDMIKAKIYVISIGWNHFYNQDITMKNRNDNSKNLDRLAIFKNNAESLLKSCHHFTMRHNGDCEKLKKIVSEKYHEKIGFDFCPVIEYVASKFSSIMKHDGEYHVFEIKDDRPNRRYYKKTKEQFYNELLIFIQRLLSSKEKVAFMSHDGSTSFYNFLRNRGINVPIINNTIANEEGIIRNYSFVKKLYCTAGHSQMMAHALGIDYYSLICHDKLKYFLQDVGRFDSDNYCLVNEENINDKICSK